MVVKWSERNITCCQYRVYGDDYCVNRCATCILEVAQWSAMSYSPQPLRPLFVKRCTNKSRERSERFETPLTACAAPFVSGWPVQSVSGRIRARVGTGITARVRIGIGRRIVAVVAVGGIGPVSLGRIIARVHRRIGRHRRVIAGGHRRVITRRHRRIGRRLRIGGRDMPLPGMAIIGPSPLPGP